MIQISKKTKVVDKEKLLEEQNKIRKYYGLQPLKRIQQETILYCLGDDRQQKREKHISLKNGGMYQ